MSDTEQKPRSKVIQLTRSVKFADKTYDHLELTAPTVSQMEAANREANPVSSNVILVANNAKIPPGAVRELDWDDMEAAVEFLQGFTKSGHQTGAS
ncbi:MAG TPA: phage tail assembly protein [Rhizomicrobium sp.]|jgi:hypothetical protein